MDRLFTGNLNINSAPGRLPMVSRIEHHEAMVHVEGLRKDTISGELDTLEKLRKARELTAPAVKWNREQQPSQSIGLSPDGRYTISNVRWGFKEGAEKKDWEPRFQQATIDPSR